MSPPSPSGSHPTPNRPNGGPGLDRLALLLVLVGLLVLTLASGVELTILTLSGKPVPPEVAALGTVSLGALLGWLGGRASASRQL